MVNSDDRLRQLDWAAIEADIGAFGHAQVGPVLEPEECRALTGLYGRDELFRSTIDMARYRFGEGQYRYFSYPLPTLLAAWRPALYRHLAPIANRMAAAMGREADFPPEHAAYLERCHTAGQTRPTPLILRYGEGGYNCLHQDLYGELVFPLQAAVLLSRPGEDFEGGEFLLVEQRPRAQSVGEVVALQQGEMVIFPVNERPVQGARGIYRCRMRHGVSRLRRGSRFTLGLILHDAA
tara:strand:- start:83 stop:793 length:711 start_codon:yes stop_codon:yes gene_type:complete